MSVTSAAVAILSAEVALALGGGAALAGGGRENELVFWVGCTLLLLSIPAAAIVGVNASGRRTIVFASLVGTAVTIAALSVLVMLAAAFNRFSGCDPAIPFCVRDYESKAFNSVGWRESIKLDLNQFSPRGEMYDDLIRRLSRRPIIGRRALLELLGTPSERRRNQIYWWTGRWRNNKETCSRAWLDRHGHLSSMQLVSFLSYDLKYVTCGDSVVPGAPALRR